MVVTYQNTVLQANQEVEDGLVTYLRSQTRSKMLNESVDASVKAVNELLLQLQVGAVDFNRYALIAQNLVVQQDAMASAKGQIAQGLIATYRALGGGWEIRLKCESESTESAAEATERRAGSRDDAYTEARVDRGSQSQRTGEGALAGQNQAVKRKK